MNNPEHAWQPTTHILVRHPDKPGYDIPMRVEPGERVIGVVATDTWAIDGVYDVIDGDLRRDRVRLVMSDIPVPHRGVAVAAVERRARCALPREFTTLGVEWATRILDAVRAEVISPTQWYRIDHRCANEELTATDAATARLWGCCMCGRDPDTEYTPHFEGHLTGERLDPTINLVLVVVVCPSCHDILHQPLAPDVREMMYGLRPPCPRCDARHANLVASQQSWPPLPIGVAASSAPEEELPDFQCGSCGHEW